MSWARLDLVQALIRSNRVAEAAAVLAVVRATAAELVSRPLMARVEDLERTARGRGTIDEPWHPLTTREFEVARLIAAGMTNSEIAEDLTIAPKTASAHVEHILAKLGVTRRAEIAAWVARIAPARPTENARAAVGVGRQGR
jgi:DNA-binding CsgD family transcriptional regulator